ncbi:aconitate hydratase [Streptomyces sp. SID13031]|uniref:aconitate hydratase n=1 Tax=Streptomyces sp. SID13031 TaxID=2706046 RepID=UPI0013CA35D1|nr:aconitate hydratase [Streptomyces sp. SID13031]NEA37534.1 aconitate hydratase [Streptomyces sp. SID13031]
MNLYPLAGVAPAHLPRTLRILLENGLRHGTRTEELRNWVPGATGEIEVHPSRVFLHDTNGVPVLADLAAMRDAVIEAGGDPSTVDPVVPAELVIDHSVIADVFGRPDALQRNVELEYRRNSERYRFLRWGQQSFKGLKVVPPGSGIMHQVNLEYLARVVEERDGVVFPDLCLGTDSHTTMVNGLGVLGWGIGGIEAEAAMLGQSISMMIPPVAGVRLTGSLPAGATATDLVLTLTERLRCHGVVGKLVEFHGPGLTDLPVADRATIANMSPEFGSTAAWFPIDDQTLTYLTFTGRPTAQVRLVETYAKTQGLWHDPTATLRYDEDLTFDLATVVPSIAGPSRPDQRINLAEVKQSVGTTGAGLSDGAVVVAAITSCTNTSNPAVMVAAGLLAKAAVERGLVSRPWVKTTLSPGSRVVMRYLGEAGLTPYLEKLGFHLAGFGCMTCIGASGALIDDVAKTVREKGLSVAAVLSGNRNFEGRIQPDVRANYLASPPLVIAYALTGRMDVDLITEPLGLGTNAKPVYLKDIWPRPSEIDAVIREALRPEMFAEAYDGIFEGDERWQGLAEAARAETFAWDEESTYLRRPPYFDLPATPGDLEGARVLVRLGDSVTTDHLSPAGAIPPDSVAGRYLRELGVNELNTYASRRGNHLVMMRGAFGNLRLRNSLAGGIEGGVTRKDGELLTIFEAAMAYRNENVPVVVVAGQNYGTGSSRDWAAKGPALLGVRAVLAQSFERIHRSNLVGLGILPLEFLPGEGDDLTGEHPIDITLTDDGQGEGYATATSAGRSYRLRIRLDTPREHEYYRAGGVLPYVLARLGGGVISHAAAV